MVLDDGPTSEEEAGVLGTISGEEELLEGFGPPDMDELVLAEGPLVVRGKLEF